MDSDLHTGRADDTTNQAESRSDDHQCGSDRAHRSGSGHDHQPDERAEAGGTRIDR